MKALLACGLVILALGGLVGALCVYMRLHLGFWPWEDWR